MTRVMASMLFGVSAIDAATFVAVPAVLATVVFAATAIPALRTTRVDPIANCSLLLGETPPDPPGIAPGTNLPTISGTNYSEEACVADNPKNAKMLACGFQNAGLRVFDIRDPQHAKEIAYWKAGAVRTEVRPSSGSWTAAIPGLDRTVDKTAHWARWVVRGNEHQLWIVSDGNGFQILRFTDNFVERNQDLFEDSGN